MTITEIYKAYTAGSEGFIEAVETHCGFDIDRDDIREIANMVDDIGFETDEECAAEFMQIWENGDF